MFETELEHGNRSDLDNLASNSRLWKPVSWPCPPRKWSSKLVSCRFGGGNVSMSRMCWRCILEADVAISGQIPTPSMLGPRFYVFVERPTLIFRVSVCSMTGTRCWLLHLMVFSRWLADEDRGALSATSCWMNVFRLETFGFVQAQGMPQHAPAIVTCECLKII